ncbi:MAG TPA: type 2 lanthipeptide synthetase LanM family protein [Gemmatimonadales bacterium]|nr:type 2 lanthipeptide synthetase LanM family protein [Gemmatimonadales bacterium]
MPSPADHHAAAWCHALTLSERLAALRERRPEASSAPEHGARGRRRLARWRAQPPFSDDALFARRLAAGQLHEHEMLRVLAEPAEACRDRITPEPAWLAEVEALHAALRGGAALAPAELAPEHPLAGALALVEPLLRDAREWLRKQVVELAKAHPAVPFDAQKTVAMLFASLPGQLLGIMGRTLVLELHVAKLSGELRGDTPQARFRSYVDRLRRPGVAAALLEEYPVLARQLAHRVHDWREASLAFVSHLFADWRMLRDVAGADAELGQLAAIRDNAGDRHRGGKAVLIAEFSSGARLVYKPRCLAIDRSFQDLLRWVNEHGWRAGFRTLNVLSRPDHGWVEFAHAAACRTTDELHRFHERLGGYLALLYALEATDFHCENVLAAGEHPVLLDLEALFHARRSSEPGDGGAPEGLVAGALDFTVLRIGLLPRRLFGGEGSDGVDISGMGAPAGRETPFTLPRWEQSGTDEMRLVRKSGVLPGADNRPTLNGSEVSPLDYADAIADGFRHMYEQLREQRDALLAPDGPLTRFRDDEARTILRPTRTYARLLQESFHPDALRDALDRDRLLDRLWTSAAHARHLDAVIPAEQEDLRRGDIPVFTTRPGSRALWTSRGERIDGYFPRSGLECVAERLSHLGPADLERQLWFVRASLATLSTRIEPTRRARCAPPPEAAAPAPERLVAAACRVGARLAELAIRNGKLASWIGLSLVKQRSCELAPLSVDLYDGLPGVALFLAYLGQVTGEARYAELARAASAMLHARIESGRSRPQSIGGFAGWGGVIHVLTHLAALWDEPERLRAAEAAIELLPPLVERDGQYDVIAGAAGCIVPLLGLHRLTGSAAALAAARRCGDHLLQRAVAVDGGAGWPSSFAPKPLTGLSHGAAGIAWALLELWSATGDRQFRALAQRAIAYERAVYSLSERNWPDFRTGAPADAAGHPARFQNTWCHGAPGIALARLASLRHLDEDAIRAEIESALQSSSRARLDNHSLCHGALGNLEPHLVAAQTLKDRRWDAHVARASAQILAGIERDGWRCGNAMRLESPGLMTGLAGIGYQLLRLAHPRCVPSILLLAPPSSLSAVSRG